MDGSAKVGSGAIGAPPLVWQVEQLRDYTGDGLSDILWRNTSTEITVVWQMNGFTKAASESLGVVDSAWGAH